MSVQPVERNAASRLRAILGTGSHPVVEPPLRAELFLIAHDDETGRPQITPARLDSVLAAAVLLELWLDGKVQIGWRFVARQGIYQADPGLITIRDATATGDPLKDTALAMLWQSSSPRVPDFIRAFATADLYERVRGHMIATGILHRTGRRGFFRRADRYTAAREDQPVRARTRVRDLATSDTATTRHHATRHDLSELHDIALTALVARAGLARRLPNTDETLQHRLDAVARLNPTIRDITGSIGRSK